MIALAVVARLIWSIPSGFALLVLVVGWPLTGTMITIDDDLSGGWSNGGGTLVPEWKMLWWLADLLLVAESSDVIAYDCDLQIRWRSRRRGLDGIELSGIDGVHVFGTYCHDPDLPWRRFRLDLFTGKLA